MRIDSLEFRTFGMVRLPSMTERREPRSVLAAGPVVHGLAVRSSPIVGRLWCVVLATLLLLSTAGGAAAREVAIVVNKENPVNELTFRELAAIFELQQQFWKNGARIHVIIQSVGRPERNVMLKTVYHKTDDVLNKYWLNRMFKAEIPDLPQSEASDERVKQEVAKRPNAIGFIDAANVDETVKVLRIDGLLPGADKYRVKSED